MKPSRCITKRVRGALPPHQAYPALQSLAPFALLESSSVNASSGKRSLLGLGPTNLYQCKNGGMDALNALQRSLDSWQGAWAGSSLDYACVFMMFSYEWKNVLETLPQTTQDDMGFPDAVVIASQDLVVWDHVDDTVAIHCSYDVGAPRAEADALARSNRIAQIISVQQAHEDLFFFPSGPPQGFPQGWACNIPHRDFLRKVETIQRFIAQGDIYQANLSQRFQTETDATGWTVYETLRRINPAPFAGYLKIQDWELISCSPERLVLKEGNRLRTRPIAGTRPRGKREGSDRLLQKDLLLSPKERSEHIMLVDLERNDLGKVCERGSVRVDEMMVVEKYSHVQHIVSDVEGALLPDTPFKDVLKAVFPGGTITGVPKIRCMEILDALEPTARGPYTGSFGYFDCGGNFDLNIAIRTLLKRGENITLQCGAGIVADSQPAAEYQETLDKALAMALAVEIASATIRG